MFFHSVFQLTVLCLDDSLLNNGMFPPPTGSQPILDPPQLQVVTQNHIVSPLMTSPQQMVASPASQPQVMTSQQTVVPRQSPVVLSARNPVHVFNGNQGVTSPVKLGQKDSHNPI